MKDEIKEILNGLNVVIKHGGSVEINSKECKKIIDYITNLQERKITKEDVNKYFEENMCVSFDKFIENCDEQEKLANYYKKENERLKEELKNRPIVDFTFDTYKELENYKSRCENAQDLISHELSHLKANDEETWNKEFYDENNKLDYRKLCIELLNQVANLLDGGDE